MSESVVKISIHSGLIGPCQICQFQHFPLFLGFVAPNCVWFIMSVMFSFNNLQKHPSILIQKFSKITFPIHHETFKFIHVIHNDWKTYTHIKLLRLLLKSDITFSAMYRGHLWGEVGGMCRWYRGQEAAGIEAQAQAPASRRRHWASPAQAWAPGGSEEVRRGEGESREGKKGTWALQTGMRDWVQERRARERIVPHVTPSPFPIDQLVSESGSHLWWGSRTAGIGRYRDVCTVLLYCTIIYLRVNGMVD